MTVHIRNEKSANKNGYARGICGKVAFQAYVPTLANWHAYPVGRICRRCVQVGTAKS